MTTNEKLTARIKRGVKALRSYEAHKKIADAQWKAAHKLLGGDGFGMCFSVGDNHTSVEIPLATYLTLFPDEQPKLRQWEYSGILRQSLSYPAKPISDGERTIWVDARTASVVVGPAPAKAETPAGEGVAA